MYNFGKKYFLDIKYPATKIVSFMFTLTESIIYLSIDLSIRSKSKSKSQYYFICITHILLVNTNI